jgi:hypothetical protein
MTIKERTNKDTDLNVLEQVLETFFSIDKKILDLHKCSSDDFLSLNKTLKKNHQKASYITDNVSSAFEKIGPQGNINNLNELKNSFGELQAEIQIFEKEININLDILERIQANFSLMFVPINNFRQNLAALKLLLSNIKLTNNLYDRSLKNFSENESARIEGVINKVKESCPVFEENIYVIQKHVKTLYQDLSRLKELIFSEILNKLELLQNDFDVIEKHHAETHKQKDSIETIAQNCKTSVGSIITNLQYHDIIRQKMEHIQQTHKLIINELNDNNSEAEKMVEQPSSNPFFLQIPQIIEIQTAQLLHTNKDYQNAIDHISKKMIEIGQDMTAIARIYKTLSSIEYKGRSVSKDKIGKLFDQLVNQKNDSITKFMELSKDVTIIQKIINDLFDKFRDLEMIENSIEQAIIDKISFGNLLISEEKETASQAQQILKLYADNHFEKNKIRTLFENTNYQLIDFVKSNADFMKNKNGINGINASLEIAETNFRQIAENLDFLENIQDDVVLHSQEINEASKEVVGNVKYYDFFEKTIDELVTHFESINTVLTDHGQVYFDETERKKGLEQIEKYYTMKSERIIHNSSILASGNREELQKMIENSDPEDNNKEGNDVEFF